MEIEQENEVEQQRISALDGIGQSLEGLKEEAVRWRVGFEMEWTQDYQQYNLTSRSLPPSKREGAPPPTTQEAEYRQSADNITRPKVIITASRLGDMLFPTNEANWDLGITPKPDVPEELIPPPPPGPPDESGMPTPGQPYTEEQLLEAKRAVARKACNSMRDTIRDQFGEAFYDEAGRACIFDGCLYGTGVLSGPILKNKRRHTARGRGGAYVDMIQEAKPTVEHVDLWSFFPQPSRSIEECEHAFRLHILPRRGVMNLARQPGFDRAQIARLLAAEPAHGALVTAAMERGALRPDANVVLSGRYEVWQYRGPIRKAGFQAFVDGLVAQGAIKPGEAQEVLLALDSDHLHEIDAEVWFSQGVVIKMALSTLAPGELGYYVFNYEKNPNSIFGHGVAYLCRDDQHATTQLWRAMMLNSMMSAGPQIGVRKDLLVAQPGDARANTLSADRPRVWALSNDTDDIKKALSVFVIPNVTAQIMALYERAKANADEHTMTPLIAQGEPTSAVPTSSGMAMLMNAANVVMRRLAKAFDDQITVPLVSAFYDWNMVNNPDESIRGDYCVIPKGASYLLIKDVQAQHLQLATQLFSTNPVLAPYMKGKVFADKNIEMLDMAPNEMLYTEEQVAEIQAKQGEQPDPDTLKAQADIATAEAAKVRAEAEAAYNQHRMEWEREERNLKHAETMADIQARERIQEMQLQVSQNQLAAKLADMESKERVEMQRIIATLTAEGAKVDLGQYAADIKAQVEAEKIVSNEAKVEKEIRAEQPNPKIQ